MSTSAEDLAKRIKERFPDYAEIPDYELAAKVIKKFPDYGAILSPFDRHSLNEGVSPKLVRAIAGAEGTPSGITSGAGAMGQLQVIPETGLRYVSREEWATPEGKILAGVRYLKHLTDRFGIDNPDQIAAAYHAGEGSVDAAMKRGRRLPHTEDKVVSQAQGRPFYTDTDYVPRFMSRYEGEPTSYLYSVAKNRTYAPPKPSMDGGSQVPQQAGIKPPPSGRNPFDILRTPTPTPTTGGFEQALQESRTKGITGHLAAQKERARNPTPEMASIAAAATPIALQNNPNLFSALSANWPKFDGQLTSLPQAARWVVETMALGGAHIEDALAGAADFLAQNPSPKTRVTMEAARDWLRSQSAQIKGLSAEAPRMGAAAEGLRDVGAGAVGFAPVIAATGGAGLVPSAIAGGLYSGAQSRGRGESGKEQAINTALGTAQFALQGIPAASLPLKSALAQAALKVGLVSGGTAASELLAGRSPEDALKSGAVMGLFSSPEFLHGLKDLKWYRHSDLGEVVASPDQTGVGKGKLRVLGQDGGEHVIIQPSRARNQRAVPIAPKFSDLPDVPVGTIAQPRLVKRAGAGSATTQAEPASSGKPTDWLDVTPEERAQILREEPLEPPDHPIAAQIANGAVNVDEVLDAPVAAQAKEIINEANTIQAPARPATSGVKEPEVVAPENQASTGTSPVAQEGGIKPPPRVAGERQFPKSAEAAGLPQATDLTYDVISDKDSVARAKQRLDEQGIDAVLSELYTKPESQLTKDDSVAMQIAAHQLDAAGDHARAIEVINALGPRLTRAGQFVQSASLIGRLTPEGVLLEARRRLGPTRELSVDHAKELVEAANKQKETELRLSQVERERDAAQALLNKSKVQRTIEREAKVTNRIRKRATLDEEAVVIKQNIAAEFARIRGQQGIQPSGLAGLDPEGVITKELLRYARNRIEAHVGLKAEALIDEMHGLVEQFGISRRQVEEVLAFGLPRGDTRSEATKRLAEIRSERKQILSERDVAEGRLTEKVAGPPNVVQRNAARLKELEAQETEWNRRLAENDFSSTTLKQPKPKIPFDDAVKKAQTETMAARREFLTKMEAITSTKTQRVARGAVGLRRANLLTAVKTHVRNLTSNLGFQGSEELARPLSAVGDRLAGLKTGERTTTGSDIPAVIRATYAAAIKEGPRRAADIMTGKDVVPLEGFHNAAEGIESKMQLHDPNTGSKVLDGYIRTVFRSMEAEDAVFKVYAFRRELADIAKAQAVREGATDVAARAKEIQAHPTDAQAIEAATYADYATFQNKNKVSNAITTGKRALGTGGQFAIEQIAPFDRTPTNIIARSIENSPLGFVSAVNKYRKIGTEVESAALAKRAVNQAVSRQEQKEFARTFGRASTGTILSALGVLLAYKGLLSGATDYDTNKKDYMVKRRDAGGSGMLHVPLTNQRISIIDTPVGKSVATAAGLYDIWAKDGKKDTKDAKAKATAKLLLDMLILDQPLVRGLRDLGDSKSFSEGAADYASSYIPASSALKAGSEAIDTKARMKSGEGAAAQFKLLTPMTRQSVKVDPAYEQGERGDLYRRILRMIDPFNTTTEGHGPKSRKK